MPAVPHSGPASLARWDYVFYSDSSPLCCGEEIVPRWNAGQNPCGISHLLGLSALTSMLSNAWNSCLCYFVCFDGCLWRRTSLIPVTQSWPEAEVWLFCLQSPQQLPLAQGLTSKLFTMAPLWPCSISHMALGILGSFLPQTLPVWISVLSDLPMACSFLPCKSQLQSQVTSGRLSSDIPY